MEKKNMIDKAVCAHVWKRHNFKVSFLFLFGRLDDYLSRKREKNEVILFIWTNPPTILLFTKSKSSSRAHTTRISRWICW